jgi:hypothetical protein
MIEPVVDFKDLSLQMLNPWLDLLIPSIGLG